MNTTLDLRKRRPGERLYIETDTSVWCLTAVDPANLNYSFEGTDQAFRTPVRGTFVKALLEEDGKVADERFGEIVEGWKFYAIFQNAMVTSEVVRSLRIEGEGWNFDVF
jgi:hypothetical protein